MSNEEPLKNSIAAFSSLRYRWLAFSPALEQSFQSEGEAFRSRRLWLEGLVGIGLYIIYAVLHEILAPDRDTQGPVLRFGFVLPLVAVVNIAVMFRLPAWLRDSAIAFASCVAGSVELLLNRSATPFQMVGMHLAIVAVLVFTNTVMRLHTGYAVGVFAWALSAEGYVYARGPAVHASSVLIAALMVMAIGLLTLTANYSSEREARLAFLRYSQKQEVIGSLVRSNKDLLAAAFTDTLTGLANRAALENHLKKIWPELAISGVVCSAVVVDIDHFKKLNDRYGHLYGDRVLKRVARLLAEALRGNDDFIARFGGEEFIVLLPLTPGHLAMIVAERLRILVELAGLPSLRGEDPSLNGLRATISCGVASTFPHFYSDPYSLIGLADEALYRAKKEGRNLVRGPAAMEELSAAASTLVSRVWH